MSYTVICPKCGNTDNFLRERRIDGKTFCKECNYEAKHSEFIGNQKKDKDIDNLLNEFENAIVSRQYALYHRNSVGSKTKEYRERDATLQIKRQKVYSIKRDIITLFNN